MYCQWYFINAALDLVEGFELLQVIIIQVAKKRSLDCSTTLHACRKKYGDKKKKNVAPIETNVDSLRSWRTGSYFLRENGLTVCQVDMSRKSITKQKGRRSLYTAISAHSWWSWFRLVPGKCICGIHSRDTSAPSKDLQLQCWQAVSNHLSPRSMKTVKLCNSYNDL